MKSATKKMLLATAVLASAATISLPAVAAFIQAKLMVQNLFNDPKFAQNTSQDLLLRTDDHGSTYLYVEHEEGALLATFDVSDPAHMKLTASVPIGSHGAYDFVNPIGGSAELVGFARDPAPRSSISIKRRNPRCPRFPSSRATSNSCKPVVRHVCLQYGK